MPRAIRLASCTLLRLALAFAGWLVLSAPSQVWAQQLQLSEAQSGLALQPQILDRTLAGVKPPEPGGPPQLYFVGFAGFGPEAVFKREVLAVQRLFDERFGTRGRSVALINHASTLHDVPMATLSNLQRTLQHVGSTMNRERDVLFLFLTSHGQEGVFAVVMPRLRLRHLTPGQLRRALDGSGIRNRVIVISACHSGSFIPPLADAHTLVITAARADRTSFGCDDRRRWTYFGDAYFNRALRQETSFLGVFRRARMMIRLWETADKLTPSLPQTAGGQALEPLLASAGKPHAP